MIYTILIFISVAILLVVFIKKIPDIRKIELPKWINIRFKSKPLAEKPQKIVEKKDKTIPAVSKSHNFFAKPNNEDALFDEADMFFRHGNLAEAEKLYIKIVSINPKNIKVYNRLGVIYMEKKEYSDAKEAFLIAVKLDPKKASRHYNLATTYDELREYRNAQESLEEALKLDKDNKKYLKYLEDLKQKIDYRYDQMKRKED